MAVAVGVCFSVLLISVSQGVSDRIQAELGNEAIRHSGLLNVDTIDQILTLLTLVVLVAMLAQTAAAIFILGTATMRSRRQEIGIRRQSGVLRRRILGEFAKEMLAACLMGGIFGEAGGVVLAIALRSWTVLPVALTPVAIASSFPSTVLVAVLATLVPAWRAANASPALLRRGS